ncbi:hypothetical protein AUEXF2481DRAFT_292926 [Aureobasidium subglaciale EXF-2481]|uniref:C2H2-type domain-containing protein n=1 Tax=Aureobasidium subglaciale (strain EXF-2481) TaxID=1043005 RepID=A0A074Z547_AURSE|nr:uncharacterized protein AUEXF2481DRAFT_292926 [Aureobasidium subglaciale EXF-2481]KAI5208453.1 hypothetical protein E4T38_02917 [Aureobasidium subglaciale]KAI5227229.1 hypothetical protein E4T40_02646 [Aureobasidium subglaciale]KAI5230554.1 hypothetical protein E4T41_02916 [Aureobasidium subglaciale]KAI5264854.1 hypothetical protein E4T46_02694 [Aureobasidium subglaciale]KEQ94096.1 hypothetical protein AUEXF2481DRAFT_292926 [Aureobasidium subglaciale EXF-2481]
MSSNTSLRRTNPSKPFHCSFCNRGFARHEHLKRHITTHTNEKSYACFCGKAFARKDLLKRHEQNGKHLVTPPSDETPPAQSIQTECNGIEIESSTATPEHLGRGQMMMLDGHLPQQSAYPLPAYAGGSRAPDATDLFAPDADFTYSNDFGDFFNFIDTMGLNAGLDFLHDPEFNMHDPSFSGDGSLYSTAEALQKPSQSLNATAAVPPSHRIRPMEDDFDELGPVPCPWRVHEEQRASIAAALLPFQDKLTGFKLPSRLMLGRYVTAFFEDYRDHLPIIHPATSTPSQYYKYPGLFLALTAIGAVYRYENKTARELFRAGKEVVLASWQDEDTSRLDEQHLSDQWTKKLRNVQAALLLDKFAFCQCDLRSAKDTLTIQSLLAGYLRSSSSIATFSPGLGRDNWNEWVLHESFRRTQLATFFVLNMHTVFFNAPPMVLSSQLDVDLPCSTAEWMAPSACAWADVRSRSLDNVSFRDAFQALFSDSPAGKEVNYSPFANLVIVHALVQRVYLARQLHNNHHGALRDADMDEIGLALKQWTAIWKQAPESILDPLNPDGSNSLTSTAFLGLARIRLYSNYTYSMRFGSWDAKQIASSLFEDVLPARSSNMTLALLHSVHALNLLVKFGIRYISRIMFVRWDSQNLFYYLEAAVFLSKWLEELANTHHANHAAEAELKVVGIVVRIVEEVAASLEPFESLGHIYTLNDLDHGDLPAMLHVLSSQLARSWAYVFNTSGSPWPIVRFLGSIIDHYAGMLEKQNMLRRTASSTADQGMYRGS